MEDDRKKGIRSFWHTVHVIGLLLLGVFVTLGLMYWQGDVLIASLYSLLLLVFLTSTVQLLRNLKKSNRYQKIKRKWEKYAILPLYLILALLTLSPTVHFLNVNLDLKAQVIGKVEEQFSLLDKNVENYSNWVVRKKSDYELNRATALANGRINSEQKNAEVRAFNNKMDMELNAAGTAVESFKRNVRTQLRNWNFLALMSTQSVVENRIVNINQRIKEGSADHPFTENNPFLPEQKVWEPIELNKMMSSIFSDNLFYALPLFIIFHLMILSPYLLATRSGFGFVKSGSNDRDIVKRRRNN